jgi:hypothetical protein
MNSKESMTFTVDQYCHSNKEKHIRIVMSSVGRHVVGINGDCLSYDMKNVGEAK